MKVRDCINIGCPYKSIVGNGYSKGLSRCRKTGQPIKGVKKCPIAGRDIREVCNEYREKIYDK